MGDNNRNNNDDDDDDVYFIPEFNADNRWQQNA